MSLVDIAEFVSGSFARALASQTAGKILSHFWGWRDTVLPVRESAHFRELYGKIKDMPFLYRDLESEEILDGYVEEDKEVYDLTALQSNKSKIIARFPDDRIRTTQKAILLGGPGIGKTTFVRQAILSVILGKGYSERFIAQERLVPFYVPLKAVNPTERSPVISYILDNNRYLHGKSGFKKLLSLARNKSLFLLLDGYDEIPIDEQTSHSITTELKLMMRSEAAYDNSAIDPKCAPLYDALHHCRIWLSSRREFFEQAPVIIGNTRAIAVELKGVRTHRAQLVKKIFDKFRRRSHKYQELLNEEYFIQEIDSSDNEFADLSFRPLFLTVMCYVYASKVIEADTYVVAWAKSMPELTLSCIDLLLVDLDKTKTKDFLGAEYAAARTAYLRRRNDWVNEKRDFLGYFAGHLMCDQKTSFDIAYLRQAVVGFINTLKTQTAITVQILKEPDKFAWQLVFSGVFVMVDRHHGAVQFDFPHRRFREVLAARYLNSAGRDNALLGLFLERSDLAEVIFSISDEADGVVRMILEKSRDTRSRRYNAVLKAVRKAPREYNPISTIQTFLKQSIDADWYVPAAEVLPSLSRPDRNFINMLRENLDPSFQHARRNSLLMSCFILFKYDKRHLMAWISDKLNQKYEEQLSPILMAYGLLIDQNFFSRCYDLLGANEDSRLDLLYATARVTERLKDIETANFCREFLPRLSSAETLRVAAFAALRKNRGLGTNKMLLPEFGSYTPMLYHMALGFPAPDSDKFYAVNDKTVEATSDLLARIELKKTSPKILNYRAFDELLKGMTFEPTSHADVERSKITQAAEIGFPKVTTVYFEDLCDQQLTGKDVAVRKHHG
jgi:hypothetical protein